MKAKFNYYRELNKVAFERRMKVPLSDLPNTKNKIRIRPEEKGAFRGIKALDVFYCQDILNDVTFVNTED